MKLTRIMAAGVVGILGIAIGSAQAPGAWQQPAAALASRIADLLGPGRAQFSIENLSTIPTADVSTIQKLLTDDLRARGITAAGAESGNAIRVTLSESASERLWVAEVVEGDDRQVAMVEAGAVTEPLPQSAAPLMLRRAPIFTSRSPVLALLETFNGLVVLEPEEIRIYARANGVWRELQDFPTAQVQLGRDMHGLLRPLTGGQGFEAWLPGQYCKGVLSDDPTAGAWRVDCNKSDDPWLLSSGNAWEGSAEPRAVAPALPALFPGAQAHTNSAPVSSEPALRAFYNAARNYFTGVISPSPAVEIPPFYSAAFVPRAAGGEALLIGGIDGKLELLQDGALSPVNGARDWGSDFGALHSSCGAQLGTQIVASGSGQATSDSLRAFELAGLEAVPASEPLAMDGTVMALWTAPDGKSAMAAVRTNQNQYEVDRVTASCN